MDIGRNGQVVFSDNMDEQLGVPSLEDESVALTFTSPPYFNYVEYATDSNVDSYTDYLEQLRLLFFQVWKKTIAGGRLVVNVANMKSRKAVEGRTFLYPVVADVETILTDVGFTFFDEIVWDKKQPRPTTRNRRPLFGSYPFPPTPKIASNSFENILIFVKEGKRERIPMVLKERDRITLSEWREFTKGIWAIATDRDKHHPATFPIELAERVIRLYSFTDDVVLDPYVGSGTTVIASELWNRKGIGFEISSDYQECIRDRAAKCLDTQLEML